VLFPDRFDIAPPWPLQPVPSWAKLWNSSTWTSLRETRFRLCTSGLMEPGKDWGARPGL